MTDSAWIELSDVSLGANVGQGMVLQQLSFAISRFSRTAIVGPSGAGKTSLLRLINRLVDPSNGQIRYRQRPLDQYPVTELRRHIALVSQESSLLGQSVETALAYPARLKGLGEAEAKRQIVPWLDRLQIPRDWLGRSSAQLSVGQRQRVAIARTLITEPDVLLLDEPTSAQDLGYAQYLLEYLKNADEQLTVIMVNHQLELVAPWATHTLYLQNGRVADWQPAASTCWEKITADILNSQTTDSW